MRRLAPLLVVLALFAAGCGGGGKASPQSILSETASNLAKIKSGTLGLSLLVSPRGTGVRGFGFELHGPFSIARSGLPVLRVAYTQIASGRQATVTLISTGRKGFVTARGKTYELPPSALDRLRTAAGSKSGVSGLNDLRVDDWVVNPKRVSCGAEAPAVEDCIQSKLNVVNAANDLLDVAQRVTGGVLPRIEGANAKQLRQSVRASKLSVRTGKKDRLLRSLVVDVDFGFQVPEILKNALGNIVGAKVHFALSVARANLPVSVAAPKNALPASQYPG